MILTITVFDFLSLSVFVDFSVFIFERVLPNTSALVALIFLIRHIWIPSNQKTGRQKKTINDGNNL